MLVRSLRRVIFGIGLAGVLLAPARMPAAVAASPAPTASPSLSPTVPPGSTVHYFPTPTPPPYLKVYHPFPTPAPLPTSRISIDGGATWMAIEGFIPPNGPPVTPTRVNLANIGATHDEKTIIKAALARTPTPKTMLVYYTGLQWTLIEPRVDGPLNDYYDIEISMTSIIRPLPTAAAGIVPRFFNSPSPAPTASSAHGGSGSGGAPVSGHGGSGSSPVAPQPSPSASP